VYVQPYFPEPETVPGNAADTPYDVRLAFIKKVTWIHFWLCVVILLVGVYLPSPIPLKSAAWNAAGCWLLLSALRNLHRSPLDRLFTPIAFVGFALMLAWTLQLVNPTYDAFLVLGTPIAFAAAYTAFCGRDYSFMGNFMISGIATVLFLVGLFKLKGEAWPSLGIQIAVSLGVLFFYVYDLASLLQRRRLSEGFLAAVDIFRDVLNFLTYGFRVIEHWKKFRVSRP